MVCSCERSRSRRDDRLIEGFIIQKSRGAQHEGSFGFKNVGMGTCELRYVTEVGKVGWELVWGLRVLESGFWYTDSKIAI
jgi:hypothetical protein